MNPYTDLIELISWMETNLQEIYDFKAPTSANNHLVQKEEVQQLATPHSNQRAMTISYYQNEELFIGVYLERELIDRLVVNIPLKHLNEENLDAFCVVAEEISHFHYIIQRSLKNIPLTKLELEWQAEIDKMLLCWRILLCQDQSPSMHGLLDRLYTSCNYIASQSDLYMEATYYAQKFWYRHRHLLLSNNWQSLLEIARSNYQLPLSQKWLFNAG